MKTLWFLGLLLFLVASVAAERVFAFTGQTIESFTSNAQKDTTNTSAVWNFVLNRVTPPLTICEGNGPPCTNNDESFDFDIGDGSDGPFDVGTYQNFGTVNGFTITINTNLHPTFNFTYFNLPSSYTIVGTGTNPLWIKALGAVTIAGTINCNGGNGADATANINAASAGGVGACGGANGGAGGSTLASGGDGQNGSDGDATGGNNTHGGGGTHSANALIPGGGGGGGAYGTGSGNGVGNAGVGTGGAHLADPYLVHLGSAGLGPGGGSGGGGGGACLPGCSNTNGGGGGGGAGGGIIRIAAGGDFLNTGLLEAKGGSGGNSNAGLGAGGGGSGGGGTIFVASGGNVTDNGTMDATHGTLGAGGTAGDIGGSGGNGRTWVVSALNFVGGGGENPNFAGGPGLGEVHYKFSTSYIAQSKGYDSLNTSPTYNSFSLTDSLPGTSTVTTFVGGSNDNFVLDDTGFVAISNVSSLAGKRFFRFKMVLQLNPGASAANTPVSVSAVNANYSGFTQTNFQFNPACGHFSDPGDGPGEFIFDLFLCFLLGALTTGRLRKDKVFRQPRKSRLL